MGGTVFYGPAPYLSFTNSPFNTNGADYFYLETFENGMLDTNRASVNGVWHVNGPGPFTDSVDADDGSVDGSGIAGKSLLAERTETNLTVTFHADNLGGHLPTVAGIVCTDIGDVLFGQPGFGSLTFSARDAADVPLGSVTCTNFGNGSALGNSPGATAEDRFFGVSNPAGISSISLTADNSKDWEVDHLQYGYFAAPELGPELRIQSPAPDTMILSWLTNAIGYTLQETPVLPATNWIPVLIPPAISSNEYQVTVTPLASNRFYRLMSP